MIDQIKNILNKNFNKIIKCVKIMNNNNINGLYDNKQLIVYGEKIIDSNLPTVLIYGHYDVQPADPLELWTSGPFEPIIKTTEKHPDGAIFARGSCDDKGQFYSHVKAFEIMMNTGTLSCNVKFMIEGEEEVGSENLGVFVKENKERLKSDTILISDTGIIANDTPSITTGLKGLSYLEVEVTGPNRDLHSGLYGGAVANPINILCEMIAKMKDENNHITIPGFYDNVVELSVEERADIARAPFSLDAYKKALDLSDIHGEEGYTTMERTGIIVNQATSFPALLCLSKISEASSGVHGIDLFETSILSVFFVITYTLTILFGFCFRAMPDQGVFFFQNEDELFFRLFCRFVGRKVKSGLNQSFDLGR